MGGHLNLDEETLNLDGGTRPPYNLSTGCNHYTNRAMAQPRRAKESCSPHLSQITSNVNSKMQAVKRLDLQVWGNKEDGLFNSFK